MPYDQMGSGYGRYSRGSGEYGVKSIYGYGDQGAFYNPQQAQQYRQAQQQQQPALNQSSAPQQQPTDFFSQLAGLFGGGGQMGAPQGGSRRYGESPYQNVEPGQASLDYAKTLPPAQYTDYMNKNSVRDLAAVRRANAPLQDASRNMIQGPQNVGMGNRNVGGAPGSQAWQSMQPRSGGAGGNTQRRPMGGSVYNNEGKLVERNQSSFLPGEENLGKTPTNSFRPENNSPTRPVAGQAAPAPGARRATGGAFQRPYSPAEQSAPSRTGGQRGAGLMPGSFNRTPTLGEKNPITNLSMGRSIPRRSSGRASMGRGIPRSNPRANFNPQKGGNG
jgi:hypothetical protein